jgi:drug/metabolite transporter (DMT)-like permease
MRYMILAIGVVGMIYVASKLLPGNYQLAAPLPDIEAASGAALSDAAKTLLGRAKATALDMINQQNYWRKIAFGLGLASLLCTALATLWAALRADQSRQNDQEFLNKKITRIGALTALATLATGGSDFLTAQLVDPLDGRITILQEALVTVPAELAADPAGESGILDNLELTLARYGD